MRLITTLIMGAMLAWLLMASPAVAQPAVSLEFESMFNGGWLESDGRSTINMTVVDPEVTPDALHVAFGSLYTDEISVLPEEAVSVLAAASLLQIDGLIEESSNVLSSSISWETVIRYLKAASLYGASNVADQCKEWLQINLLCSATENPKFLAQIEPDLMAELIRDENLFVMQTEFSVYVLLRLWAFLRLNPDWSGSSGPDALAACNEYHKGRSNSWLLDTEEGKSLESPFRNLRLEHMVNHHMDVEMLQKDKIIPDSWLNRVFRKKWVSLLKVDQNVDRGPEKMDKKSANLFLSHSLRCGRTLNLRSSSQQQHMWRWTGFHMGMDLVITYDNHVITIKRNHSSDHEAVLASTKKRHFLFYCADLPCAFY